MRKSRVTLAVAACGGLAAVALAAAFVIPAVAEGSPTCSALNGPSCFKITGLPASVGAGATGAYSVNITNESTSHTLSWVTISAPGGFTITTPTGPATSETVNNLNLAPGRSTVTPISLTATAPCTYGSNLSWGASGPSNGDNDGDDFQPDPAISLLVSVTGACHLALSNSTVAFNGEPSPDGTVVSHVITTGIDSSGGPVQVEILDGSNQLIVGSSASVQLTLGPNSPAGATLTGGTATAVSGIASFTSLSIDTPGPGYTLVATSAGLAQATSTEFPIWTSMKDCLTACSSSVTSSSTTSLVSTSGTGGQFLGLGLGGFSFTCGASYPLTSDPVSFDLFSASGVPLTGTQAPAVLEISKAAVNASGHPGASSWQICYASNASFTTLSGGPAVVTYINGVPYFTGLLPGCASPAVAPCIQSRNKTNAGVEIIDFLVTGDPNWRG